MIVFKNIEHELILFKFRLLAIFIFVLICFSILFIRFVWLQIIRHDNYAAQAKENRMSMVPIIPNRGLILDRNGIILANNRSVYTLEITPSKIKGNIKELINALSLLINITQKDKKRFQKLLEKSKNFESLPILNRLTDEEVAKFIVQRYRFPGVDIQARLFRQYPYGEIAAHLVGYIGRINQHDIANIISSNYEANYNGTNYIGKEGLEKSYEKVLHGTTGYEIIETCANGRAVRIISHKPAISGYNLVLSIDIQLQKVIKEAFGNLKGALVAIDPSTGDILAYVSQPSFDPNMFIEGMDQKSWNSLNCSSDRPLVNRPLTGIYSPGSIYKPFMALAALELGKRKPSDSIRDEGFFWLGNHKFRDDKKNGHGIVNMYKSIIVSCDTYYYMLANDIGVDAIHDFMKHFGFGQITGIDLEHERRGLLPSTDWKRKAYKKSEQRKWYTGETISLGIGQGYNAFTPIQMAHATAILANNGIAIKPHVVKVIEDGITHNFVSISQKSYNIPIKQKNIDIIKQALIGVNKEGTGAQVFSNAEYTSAGKTGTAQIISIKKNEKYDKKHMLTHLLDNALYMVFAPVEKPRIAIAVIIENGGWGSEAAAPVAKKAIDYYLLNKRSNVIYHSIK